MKKILFTLLFLPLFELNAQISDIQKKWLLVGSLW